MSVSPSTGDENKNADQIDPGPGSPNPIMEMNMVDTTTLFISPDEV